MRVTNIGNIRQMHLKNMAHTLLEYHADEFIVGDFQHNKKKLNELTNVKSKKQRNRIAGYVTKLLSHKKKRTIMEE